MYYNFYRFHRYGHANVLRWLLCEEQIKHSEGASKNAKRGSGYNHNGSTSKNNVITRKIFSGLDQNPKHSKQLTCPNFLLEHPHIRDRVSCYCSICGKWHQARLEIRKETRFSSLLAKKDKGQKLLLIFSIDFQC